MKRKIFISAFLLCLAILLSSCVFGAPKIENNTETEEKLSYSNEGYFDYSKIPAFDGENPYVVVNDNNPFFEKEQLTDKSFESYGELDNKGRCTVVCANVGKDIMPTEDRGSIGSVKPSGWHTQKYDCVDGKYLYNRCHLIGYQLTGENANECNLITGTRYLNIEGMLPFENLIADYVKETDNHVLYKVSPIFLGDELVARGVHMQAYSIEDDGEGVCFNIFAYNVQPDIEIDYLTGESRYIGSEETGSSEGQGSYVLNARSKKIHYTDCSAVKDISPNNKEYYKGSIEDLINDGYTVCGICRP